MSPAHTVLALTPSRSKKSDIWKDRGRKFTLETNFFDALKVIYDNGAVLAAEEASVRRIGGEEDWKEWWEDLEEQYVR